MKEKEHTKRGLWGNFSFWQKIYICTLALFLLCLNGGVLLVGGVGQSRSLQAERSRLLTGQHYLAERLAQDMASVAARKPATLPALAENYAGSYAGQQIRLQIWYGEELLADTLPLPDKTPLPDLPAEGSRADGVLTAEGRRMLYTAQKLPGQAKEAVLYCAFDMEDFFTDWEAARDRFVVIALAASAVMAVGLYLTLKELGRPLEKLAQQARAVGQGDYAVRAQDAGNDEVAQLARAFNEMAARTGRTMARLENAAAEKQQLADSMAHELRTPLTAIGGYAEYIARADLPEEERTEACAYIMSETKRLAAMSERLLTMAALRQEGIEKAFLPLHEAAEDALRTLRPKAKQKGVLLESELETAQVWGDRVLLTSLVLNLADNAVKAAPAGGRVAVALTGGSAPLLTVRDNGPGMDEETLARLGEPFFRAEKSRSRAEGGTGLGLTFCFGVAKAHDAKLVFHSAPGQGTTVQLQFAPLQ